MCVFVLVFASCSFTPGIVLCTHTVRVASFRLRSVVWHALCTRYERNIIIIIIIIVQVAREDLLYLIYFIT